MERRVIMPTYKIERDLKVKITTLKAEFGRYGIILERRPKKVKGLVCLYRLWADNIGVRMRYFIN